MGYGGSTWDTAGTLTLDADNTFLLADAGTDEPPQYDIGWWKFTPAGSGLLTAFAADSYVPRLYKGTNDDRELLTATIDAYHVQQGIEYRIQLFRGFSDPGPTAWQITASFQALAVSPWLDDLQDDPDNYLIVTEGDLRLANPNPDYNEHPLVRPEWMNEVVRRGSRRSGHWQANETLTGDDVHNALSCCVSHAFMGDQGVQSWNAATTGTAGGAPVCVPLPAAYITLADNEFPSASVGVKTDYGSSPGSAIQISEVTGPSWGVWHLVARDNLPARGVRTDPPSPADYGYPDDAVLEWEDERVGLLGVEMADGQPLDGGTAPDHIHATQWALNARVAPSWTSGERNPWWMGSVTTPPDVDVPNRPFMLWEYGDGDVTWYPVEGTEDWDGHDWTEDYPTGAGDTDFANADAVAVAWPAEAPTDNEVDESRTAPLAVKFVLQASRFRFVYAGSTIPPLRILQRSDAATTGATRIIGGGNTRQSGGRTIGSIL